MCGALFDGLSAYSSAKAQKQGLQAQAQVNAQNAALEEQQARNSIDLGRRQMEQIQLQGAQVEAAQRNAIAENGVDVSTGSAIDLLSGTRQITSADVDTMRYNAAMESWGHKVQSTNYQNGANMAKAQAGNINPVMSGAMAFGKSFANNMAMAGGAGNLKTNYSRMGNEIKIGSQYAYNRAKTLLGG